MLFKLLHGDKLRFCILDSLQSSFSSLSNSPNERSSNLSHLIYTSFKFLLLLRSILVVSDEENLRVSRFLKFSIPFKLLTKVEAPASLPSSILITLAPSSSV